MVNSFVLPQAGFIIGLVDTFITLFNGLNATFLDVIWHMVCRKSFVTVSCTLLKIVVLLVSSQLLLALTVPVTDETRPLSQHQYFIIVTISIIMIITSADRMQQLCVQLRHQKLNLCKEICNVFTFYPCISYHIEPTA